MRARVLSGVVCVVCLLVPLDGGVGAESDSARTMPEAAVPEAAGNSEPGSRKVWEVGGVRLERDQVERLAMDMAERTVTAVSERVDGLELRPEQLASMHQIYQQVAMDVFERVVDVVERSDLSDAQKDAEIRRLVLEGQRTSHERLEAVLEAQQMERYGAWESKQVEAYKSPRLSEKRRRRRRR